MHQGELTHRYVFVVEYNRKPRTPPDVSGGRHGWVRYQMRSSGMTIKKAFNEPAELPHLIEELIVEINDQDDGQTS